MRLAARRVGEGIFRRESSFRHFALHVLDKTLSWFVICRNTWFWQGRSVGTMEFASDVRSQELAAVDWELAAVD